ncbi:hypothetical protein FS749_013762 [Ceratobasidium sp. UAMH 11750]|nr:hypothetical protein FS749_013762 [Ceratobasidium sp. UAMH 11750]
MSLSTTHRSHRRTSISVPRHSRHTSPSPSPPPPRTTSRAWSRHHPPPDPSSSSGSYTLTWQPDREDEYIALYGQQRNHEHRRPRARTVAASPEVDARAARSRPRSAPLSSSALDLCQPCPALAASARAWLAAGSRKDRRKQSQRRPMPPVRRDSGYESDDADEDTSNEGETPLIYFPPFHLARWNRDHSGQEPNWIPTHLSHDSCPSSSWPPAWEYRWTRLSVGTLAASSSPTLHSSLIVADST